MAHDGAQAAPSSSIQGRLDWSTLKKTYDREGYVVVDGIFAEQDLQQLRDAAGAVTQLTRAGKWPHRRIVGKQFPPFDKVACSDSWGVQHLMHPDLPFHDAFASFYGSSPLLDVAAYLMGTREEDMQLELFNLLIEPKEHYFALAWHRDDIRPDVTHDEEQARLSAPVNGIQWNACLYDDDCLFVVPQTHARVRDADEVKANQTPCPEAQYIRHNGGDEQAAAFDGRWQIDPPSTVRVSLKAGQTAFYSQRILHRASYLPTRTRSTLHGCYGDTAARGSEDAEHGCRKAASAAAASERARNVLQHGVEWMRDESFGRNLPGRLYPMWKNLLRMEEQVNADELGYSLEG